MCDSGGQHKVSDTCQRDKHEIAATNKLSNPNQQTFYFDEKHTKNL